MRLLPVPVKRPSAFHLCKTHALDGFKSYPGVSPVSLQGPLLFFRIPLAVPALYLEVTVPAKLLSRSMQLLQLFVKASSCCPGLQHSNCCQAAAVSTRGIPIALSHSWSLFPKGDSSLLSGRRHKGSQNNSAAEKHRGWSLHLGSYSSCKELKQLQKAGMLQCETGRCSTLVCGLASLLISFLTCVLTQAQRTASSPHPALPGAWLSLPAPFLT